jgi:hypothetical protein
MSLTVGIDPGLSGGIAVLSEDITTAVPMPVMPSPKGKGRVLDITSIIKILEAYKAGVVFIERQQAMTGQGISSTGTTMQNYGILIGILAGLRVPYEIVGARKWQRELLTVPTKGDPKAAARAAAEALFPGVDLRRSTRARKPHEGMVDAILIAEYGRRLNRVT